MTLDEHIIQLLKNLHLRIAAAESCTGGRIAAKLTAIPGASAAVQGGVVAYQNQIKSELLCVPVDTIGRYDVVSEEVAKRMMVGVCQLMHADFAIATTGYVGPTGGSDKVPLGTVWIACGNERDSVTKRLYLDGTREENLCRVVNEALKMVEQYLLNIIEN